MAEPAAVRSALFRVARSLLLLTGLAVFALGAAMVFVPGAASLLPVGALIAALGSDYFVVAAVGVVAVGFAMAVALVRAFDGVDEAAVPVVESVESAPHPGQAVDRSVDGSAGLDPSDSARERLREAAVRTLVRTEHCSRSDAERRVAEGTWTDDDAAAGFLAGDDSGLFRKASRDDERVRRTALAIRRLDDAEPSDGDDGSSDDRRTDRTEATKSTMNRPDAAGRANATVRSGARASSVGGDETPRRGGAGTGGP